MVKSSRADTLDLVVLHTGTEIFNLKKIIFGSISR